jgi:hypothetical protein
MKKPPGEVRAAQIILSIKTIFSAAQTSITVLKSNSGSSMQQRSWLS